MRSSILLLATLLLLPSCDDTPPPAATPAFDPIAFFNGTTQSTGVIETRSGAPREPIETASHASLDTPDRLHMVQTLSFGGETRERVWTLTRTAANRFDATANDMIGSARGETSGGAFHWQWTLARSPGHPWMNVTMAQWMYPMPDGSLLIRTTISKLGFILAEVTEQFRHAGKTAVAQAGAP